MSPEPILKGPVWLLQPIPYFGEELKGKWIVEPKVDGWRMQVIRYKDGRYELWGRRLEKTPNWTEKLSWLLVDFNIPKGTLLDTELYSEKGRRFIPSLFSRRKNVLPIVFVFDVIFFDGKYVGNKPLSYRKKLIESIELKPPFYRMEQCLLKDIKKHLNQIVKKGYEGIVIKKLDSLYPIGKDAPLTTDKWRKIKIKL